MSDFTQTPNLSLYKPTYNADAEQWGAHLNANADKLDAVISSIPGGSTGGFLPTAGGTMTGPLNYAATGSGGLQRAAQDRAADHLSVLDFGIVCDGVTDQGAALNTAIASTAPGTVLWVPASIYTTVTILLANGRRLASFGTSVRPPGGPTLLVSTVQIIGANTLSPVVQCQDDDGGLDHISITRNGTPPAGAVGLLVLNGNNYVARRCKFYNHDIGIYVGRPIASGGGALNTAFEDCLTWNCTTTHAYLLSSPEIMFLNHRFGRNGATDPACVSYVTIDGDNNTTGSSQTTNGVNFIRCQFNSATPPTYGVRFVAYSSPDGQIKFQNCYAGTTADSFLYVDPTCTNVVGIRFSQCDMLTVGTNGLVHDSPTPSINGLSIVACGFSGNASPPSLALTGTRNAVIVGCTWHGPSIVTLNAMAGGSFIGNAVNTLNFTGVYTNQSFVASANICTNLTQSATGLINYVEPAGNYGSQLTLGKTNQAGRVDLRRGSDGLLIGWMGINGATGGNQLDITNIGGSSNVRLNPTGSSQFLVGGTLVGQIDGNGLALAKATTTPAPGAGLARLEFVAGTTAGTAKLVAVAGTSGTPVTIMDNIGAGF